MKLKDKIAIITGSSRGIGKAITLLFAREGAKIVVNYSNSEKQANKVVEEIGKERAIAIKCDVSKEKEVKSMIDKTIKTFGRIDILVNNAGVVFDVPLFKKTLEQWDRTLDVNLKGVFLCSKYASKFMKKQKSGIMINISSTNGISNTTPTSADYDASKSAVISLTKNMAEELAPNIRVNSIAPGWVDTEMNKDLPKNLIDVELKNIFMGRFGKPEEIAAVALFLASSDSSFMTGSTVVVDGGNK